MAKLSELRHVKWVRSKGNVYSYFDTGKKKANGQPIRVRLPHLSSIGFYDSYAALMAGRTKRAQVAYTITQLVEDYEKSLYFTQRAAGTQQLYRLTNKRIVKHLGEFPVDDLQREDLMLVLDNEMTGPGAYNIFVAVLGILYRFARRGGKTSLEPTKDIAKMDIGEHEAWPEHILEAGLESEHARTRLAIHLLYFTGQRIGDVVKMRWSDIRDGAVFVTQQKTSKKLRIPLHSELGAELAKTPSAASRSSSTSAAVRCGPM